MTSGTWKEAAHCGICCRFSSSADVPNKRVAFPTGAFGLGEVEDRRMYEQWFGAKLETVDRGVYF
jgi:hypothetical protein